MQHGHRVEGEHNLLVGPLAAETHVQLVEVLLLHLGRFFDPYIGKLPFGKVMDFSFSVSSRPLKITLFPLAQEILRSESLQENSSDKPQREITCRNNA